MGDYGIQSHDEVNLRTSDRVFGVSSGPPVVPHPKADSEAQRETRKGNGGKPIGEGRVTNRDARYYKTQKTSQYQE